MIKKVKKGLVQKTLEMISLGVYDDAELVDIIKERDGLPVLTSDDIKFIIDKMDYAATLDKSTEKGNYEWRKTISEVEKKMANRLPATSTEKFRAITRVFFNVYT